MDTNGLWAHGNDTPKLSEGHCLILERCAFKWSCSEMNVIRFAMGTSNQSLGPGLRGEIKKINDRGHVVIIFYSHPLPLKVKNGNLIIGMMMTVMMMTMTTMNSNQ